MLLQATPEQVNRVWKYIREYILDTLPPHMHQGLSTSALLLRALYLETAYLMTYRRNDAPGEVIALVYLAPHMDSVLGLKTLLIYAFAAITPIGAEEYPTLYKEVQNFARDIGYERLSAFTREVGIVRMAERLGADVSSTLIQFEVSYE